MSDLELTPARPGADVDEPAGLLSHAFGFPREGAQPWFEIAGFDNLRTFRRGARTIGGLVEIPMGQFFGGRAVPAMGVAGVAIAPDERGAGTGTRMMLAMLREARARGFPLRSAHVRCPRARARDALGE